jgi:hypothetical protein
VVAEAPPSGSLEHLGEHGSNYIVKVIEECGRSGESFDRKHAARRKQITHPSQRRLGFEMCNVATDTITSKASLNG